MGSRRRKRVKGNYVKHHDISLRNAAVALLNGVAAISVGISKEQFNKTVAREKEEKLAMGVVRKFGAASALESILYYRRLLYNNTKNRLMTMKLTDSKGKEITAVIPIYTFGVDEYFRTRWPKKWAEMVKKEKDNRPKEEPKKDKK